jgi:tetratricopeptide (TPR) repeat protein
MSAEVRMTYSICMWTSYLKAIVSAVTCVAGASMFNFFIDSQNSSSLRASSPPESNAVISALDRAVEVHAAGDTAKAVRGLDKILDAEPGTIVALDLRATYRREMGDRGGSIKDYRNLILKDPKGAADYYWGLARTQEEQGDLGSAEASLTSAIRLEPLAEDLFFLRAGLKEQQKKYIGALADYDQCVRLLPKDDLNYCQRGEILSKLGRLNEAESDFNLAVRLSPNKSRGYSYRGNFYLEHKNMTGAAKDFDEAIRRDPVDGTAYVDRAFLCLCTKNQKGAFDDLSTAIRFKPRVRTYLLRGRLHELDGDISGAMKDYDQSLLLDPHNALAHRVRGAARLLEKDFNGAIRDDAESIAANPLDLRTYQQMIKTLAIPGSSGL